MELNQENNTHRFIEFLKQKENALSGASFTRDAVGIWSCKKCGFKIAGTAYDVKF